MAQPSASVPGSGSSPPEADSGLCCQEPRVGGVVEGAGEQFAFGVAKDHKDCSFSWCGLGHGAAHNGLGTCGLQAAGQEGFLLWMLVLLAQTPKIGGRALCNGHSAASLGI